jgi:protein LSM14
MTSTSSSVTLGIESKVSLISQSQIRYLGTICDIDNWTQTVTLKDVWSVGTENRPSAQRVEPSRKLASFIIFRGADIESIEPAEEFIDPAIATIKNEGRADDRETQLSYDANALEFAPTEIAANDQTPPGMN